MKISRYGILLVFMVLFLSTGMIGESSYTITIGKHLYPTMTIGKHSYPMELLYDNIWGTIYNPETRQCDDTPAVTGDGSKINPQKASQLRWIAISHNMLYNEYRQNLLIYKRINLYKGKIEYGDTIWIESPYKEINGWWVVHDTKNVKYTNSIDFLQTKGDTRLYKNDKTWSGKFENIKIYKKNGLRKNT
jgi:hypothetical protein